MCSNFCYICQNRNLKPICFFVVIFIDIWEKKLWSARESFDFYSQNNPNFPNISFQSIRLIIDLIRISIELQLIDRCYMLIISDKYREN